MRKYQGWAIISETDHAAFQEQVVDLLNKGYRFVGPTQTCLTLAGEILYTVTVVRYVGDAPKPANPQDSPWSVAPRPTAYGAVKNPWKR